MLPSTPPAAASKALQSSALHSLVRSAKQQRKNAPKGPDNYYTFTKFEVVIIAFYKGGEEREECQSEWGVGGGWRGVLRRFILTAAQEQNVRVPAI